MHAEKLGFWGERETLNVLGRALEMESLNTFSHLVSYST